MSDTATDTPFADAFLGDSNHLGIHLAEFIEERGAEQFIAEIQGVVWTSNNLDGFFDEITAPTKESLEKFLGHEEVAKCKTTDKRISALFDFVENFVLNETSEDLGSEEVNDQEEKSNVGDPAHTQPASPEGNTDAVSEVVETTQDHAFTDDIAEQDLPQNKTAKLVLGGRLHAIAKHRGVKFNDLGPSLKPPRSDSYANNLKYAGSGVVTLDDVKALANVLQVPASFLLAEGAELKASEIDLAHRVWQEAQSIPSPEEVEQPTTEEDPVPSGEQQGVSSNQAEDDEVVQTPASSGDAGAEPSSAEESTEPTSVEEASEDLASEPSEAEEVASEDATESDQQGSLVVAPTGAGTSLSAEGLDFRAMLQELHKSEGLDLDLSNKILSATLAGEECDWGLLFLESQKDSIADLLTVLQHLSDTPLWSVISNLELEKAKELFEQLPSSEEEG